MLDKLREKALKLPLKPGVYIMMNGEKEVIYVGKAKQLKNRVSSYFHGSHNAKTEAMISNIADFDVIVANSEFEALVLENSLIKHHMPKYNILLKDDKGYPFIRLDGAGEYPRFSIASKMEEDGGRYFGPYGGRSVTHAALDALLKTFRLPTCSRKFPRDIGKERPCLNYHMGTCHAYCLKDVPQAEYQKALNQAVMVLEGKTGELVKKLENDMFSAAEKQHFERAAELRDTIRAVKLLETRQHVLSKASVDTDAIGFYQDETRSCFVVLHYIEGRLIDKDSELLENLLDEEEEAVSGLVRQYYLLRGSAPKRICLPCAINDREPLEQMLSEMAGRKVRIEVPSRGEKRTLVNTAGLNAREEVKRVATREERISKTAQDLQRLLGLPTPPQRIESFDISNTGSSDIVASMVVYEKGRPFKRDYRKFKLKTVSGQDDYHSMAEVVNRRFERYKAGDAKFSKIPDLLLIDGGTAHAAAAQDVLKRLGLSIPVFGMVKDDRHRTRALVSPGGEEIGISTQQHIFSFIGNIQEETHRFAIEFHRSLRSKNSYRSELDKIAGVGEKRRNDLLKAFKSIKAIKNASLEELAGVVPKNTAQAVYEHFHTENGE